MSDDILEQSIALAQGCLASDGVFFANVNLGQGEELEWQGFPVVRRPLSFYRAVAARHGLAVDDLGSLESLGHRSGMASQDAQHMLRFSRA